MCPSLKQFLKKAKPLSLYHISVFLLVDFCKEVMEATHCQSFTGQSKSSWGAGGTARLGNVFHWLSPQHGAVPGDCPRGFLRCQRLFPLCPLHFPVGLWVLIVLLSWVKAEDRSSSRLSLFHAVFCATDQRASAFTTHGEGFG